MQVNSIAGVRPTVFLLQKVKYTTTVFVSIHITREGAQAKLDALAPKNAQWEYEIVPMTLEA